MISPNFSQLGLRPRRLRIKRYHARFRAITANYSTKNIHDSTIERMFKDYSNCNDNTNEDPTISYLEELIQKGKNETLVFGLDDVEKYSDYELKYLISNDED